MKTVLLDNLISVDVDTDEEAEEIISKIQKQIENSIKEMNDKIKSVYSLNYTKLKNTDVFMIYMRNNKTVNTANYRLEYVETENVKIYSNYSNKTITVKNLEEFKIMNEKLIEDCLPPLRICSESGEPIQKGFTRGRDWYCSEKYFPEYMIHSYRRNPWKVEKGVVYSLIDGIYKDTGIKYVDWSQDETIVMANQKYEQMTGIKAKSKENNDMSKTIDTTKPIIRGK